MSAVLHSNLGEAVALERRTIPFDYVFEFPLTGKPETLVSRTVAVSAEGPFVAHAIGYGVIPRLPVFRFGQDAKAPPPAKLPEFRSLSFTVVLAWLRNRAVDLPMLEDEAGRLPGATRRRTSGPALVEAVLRNGFRLNPEVADLVLTGLADAEPPPLSAAVLAELFETIGAPPENIQFKYALFDEGTGRAFQSDAILNTAGLGIADGGRPFRTLAQPITFATRTTIRMDVIEVSRFAGTLHVALHGYKLLGTSGTPTDVHRQIRRWRR